MRDLKTSPQSSLVYMVRCSRRGFSVTSLVIYISSPVSLSATRLLRQEDPPYKFIKCTFNHHKLLNTNHCSLLLQGFRWSLAMQCESETYLHIDPNKIHPGQKSLLVRVKRAKRHAAYSHIVALTLSEKWMALPTKKSMFTL